MNPADPFWSLATSPVEPLPPGVIRHFLRTLRCFRSSGAEARDDGSVSGDSLAALVRFLEDADVRYASPEQRDGSGLTDASEVFSAGVLLVERLCRDRGASLDGDDFARLRRGELGALSDRLPPLPRRLREILTRALRPSPADRYRNLAELSSALEAYLASRDRGSELPGAPPLGPRTGASPTDAVQRRPVSAWERAATHADSDEWSAPGLMAQMQGQTERPRRRARSVHAFALSPLDPDSVPGAPAGAGTLSAPRRPRLVTATDVDGLLAARPRRRRVPALQVVGLVALSAGLAAVWTVAHGGAGERSRPERRADEPRESAKSSIGAAPRPALSEPARPTVASPSTEPGAALATEEPRFDANAIARAALDSVTHCFLRTQPRRRDPTKDIGFGLAILFQRDGTAAPRVFFPSDAELGRKDRACVRRSLRGLRADAPPEQATAVEMRISLYGEPRVELKGLRE